MKGPAPLFELFDELRAVRDGRPTPLITAEDLVLFKLVVCRHKDRGHLDDLLLVVGGLDDEYLTRWAERLGVRDRLEEQWRRSGRALPS